MAVDPWARGTTSRWRAVAGALLLGVAAAACMGGPAGPETPTEAPSTAAPSTVSPATGAPATAAPQATDGGVGAGEPDLGTGRSVQVSATVSSTTNGMDGSYEGAGLARACGNAALNLTGNGNSFNLYFPQDEAGAIDDVTFDADDLLAGASTTAFYINLNVTNATGHAPPALVIDTREAGSGDSGTAQRTTSGGSTTLTVNATSDFGETLTLTATCGPRP